MDTQTVFKALVALHPQRDGVVGTLATGEPAGLRGGPALDPPKTGCSTAGVGSGVAEPSAESYRTQAAHHLDGQTDTWKGQILV